MHCSGILTAGTPTWCSHCPCWCCYPRYKWCPWSWPPCMLLLASTLLHSPCFCWRLICDDSPVAAFITDVAIEYRTGKFEKLAEYWISDQSLRLSNYQISYSQKNSCPSQLKWTTDHILLVQSIQQYGTPSKGVGEILLYLQAALLEQLVIKGVLSLGAGKIFLASMSKQESCQQQ